MVQEGDGAGIHVVIAGGKTGGHLFPGVAVAEALREMAQGHRVTFVGTEEGLEARVIPGLGFDLSFVDVQPLKGGSIGGRLKSLSGLPGSALRARRLLKDLQPDVVVSVGSFAAGPVTMMASMMGIPTALMEQNSYPGLTNRLLSRVVDRAFLTFEDSASQMSLGDDKVAVVGNPVRRDLLERARRFEYRSPAEEEDFHILIIGGSGGAGSFNEQLPAMFCSLGEAGRGISVRHQAGHGRAGEAEPGYEDFEGKVEVLEFIDDMAEAYRWCDLLICRAGATTIAEVLTLGIPSIMVPFPAAADDHQRSNALSIVEQGAAVMIGDEELNSDRIRNLLNGFRRNPPALVNMAKQAKSLARPEAAFQIAQQLVELSQGD